ncbi:MAG: DMT family transporter [Spirochaetaceae bacterium]
MSNYLGESAALVTALFWTITALSFEAAGNKVGSLAVNLWRLIIAFLLFCAYSLIFRGSLLPMDAPDHVWIWLTASGLVGFVIGDLFLFEAFVIVGARVAMLVYSLVPPLTALISYFILGELLSGVQWAGMALTVTGVSVVVLQRNAPARRAARHPLLGIGAALLGALGQAVGLVLSRYGAPRYDAFQATQIRAIAGIIGFLFFFTLVRRWRPVVEALRHRVAMRQISVGAFFGPFLGVSLGLYAAQNTETGVAATIIALVPVLMIPAAIFVLRERVTLREAAGALLAVTGVALLFVDPAV